MVFWGLNQLIGGSCCLDLPIGLGEIDDSALNDVGDTLQYLVVDVLGLVQYICGMLVVGSANSEQFVVLPIAAKQTNAPPHACPATLISSTILVWQ